MPIFVFLHVLFMFAGVALAYGPAALMVVAGRQGDVKSLRAIMSTSARLARWVGLAFMLGLAFGVIAIFAHGFHPLQGWLVIAYVLFVASLVMTFGFTTPWQAKVAAAADASPDDTMSPQLNELLTSPRNRALLAIDALLIVALIADMVLKPLPGRIL